MYLCRVCQSESGCICGGDKLSIRCCSCGLQKICVNCRCDYGEIETVKKISSKRSEKIISKI